MELGLNAKYATLSKDFEQSGPQFPTNEDSSTCTPHPTRGCEN